MTDSTDNTGYNNTGDCNTGLGKTTMITNPEFLELVDKFCDDHGATPEEREHLAWGAQMLIEWAEARGVKVDSRLKEACEYGTDFKWFEYYWE